VPQPEGKLVTPVGMNKEGYPRAFSQLFGFSDTLNLDASGVVVGADYVYASPVVPAGEIWVVTTASISNQSGVVAGAWVYATLGPGFAINVAYGTALIRYEVLLYVGTFYLVEGQRVGAYLSGLAPGDVITGGFLGYKMEL
jgi:hypothetical protein